MIDALKERRAALGLVTPGRLRGLLVRAEVALALVLLVGCGLVLQGLANPRHNDPGFRTENLSSVSVTLSEDVYPTPRPKADYVADALARLERRRDVEAAATENPGPWLVV